MDFDSQTRFYGRERTKANAANAADIKPQPKPYQVHMLFMAHEVESETEASAVTDAQCSMKFVIDIQPFYLLRIALQSHTHNRP